MPTPLDILRQRNLAAGKPGVVTAQQKGGIAATTLALILSATYAAEGGYVHEDGDSGGATNYGVTVAVARAAGYTGDMRNFPKHCYGNVTVCADKIYTNEYVNAPGFAPLLTVEPAIARELADTGVNMGTGRASIFFNTSMNVLCGTRLRVTGRVSPQAVTAYSVCKASHPRLCPVMLDALDGAQERRYIAIVRANPSQRKFLKGWIRARINNVPRKDCT